MNIASSVSLYVFGWYFPAKFFELLNYSSLFLVTTLNYSRCQSGVR